MPRSRVAIFAVPDSEGSIKEFVEESIRHIGGDLAAQRPENIATLDQLEAATSAGLMRLRVNLKDPVARQAFLVGAISAMSTALFVADMDREAAIAVDLYLLLLWRLAAPQNNTSP